MFKRGKKEDDTEKRGSFLVLGTLRQSIRGGTTDSNLFFKKRGRLGNREKKEGGGEDFPHEGEWPCLLCLSHQRERQYKKKNILEYNTPLRKKEC